MNRKRVMQRMAKRKIEQLLTSAGRCFGRFIDSFRVHVFRHALSCALTANCITTPNGLFGEKIATRSDAAAGQSSRNGTLMPANVQMPVVVTTAAST